MVADASRESYVEGQGRAFLAEASAPASHRGARGLGCNRLCAVRGLGGDGPDFGAVPYASGLPALRYALCDVFHGEGLDAERAVGFRECDLVLRQDDLP